MKTNKFKNTNTPAKIIKLLRTVTPAIANNNPNPIAMVAPIINFFLFGTFRSTLIQTAAKTGFITNAINKEDPKTIISVKGKYFINSPIIPGQSAKGTKAAKVVAVDAIIGKATSPTPYFAASILL